MNSRSRQDVWLIADKFVCEAMVGGMMLGEIEKLDMSGFAIVEWYSQQEFDVLMQDFLEENGCYPGNITYCLIEGEDTKRNLKRAQDHAPLSAGSYSVLQLC